MTIFKRASTVLGVLALSGCGGGGDDDPREIIDPSPRIESRVTTNQATYRRGERISVTVTYRNLTDREQSVTSGIGFVRVGVRAEGATRDTTEITGTALTVVSTERIAANGSFSESLTWGRESNTNPADALPRGRYVLTSRVRDLAQSDKIRDLSNTITLTE